MTARDSIAEHFHTGNIKSHDLNPSGISEMTIIWKNMKITASWYSSERFRSLMVDGIPYPSSYEADYIVKAAIQRSKTLLSERLSVLNGLV